MRVIEWIIAEIDQLAVHKGRKEIKSNSDTQLNESQTTITHERNFDQYLFCLPLRPLRSLRRCVEVYLFLTF
jgi:hypothetical protein